MSAWTNKLPAQSGWYWYFGGDVCAPTPCAVRIIADPHYAKPWIEVLVFDAGGDTAERYEPQESADTFWMPMQHVPASPIDTADEVEPP